MPFVASGADVLDHPVRHLELARYSSMSVGGLPGGLEKFLPHERKERISLFPSWDPSRSDPLLQAVVTSLEEQGFRSIVALRPGGRRAEEVGAGADARLRYFAANSGQGWPTLALVMGRGEDGVILCSDLDGATLFVDTWGPAAVRVGDDVFDLIWSTTRENR